MTNYREPLSPDDAMDEPKPIRKWRIRSLPKCTPATIEVDAETSAEAIEMAHEAIMEDIVYHVDCIEVLEVEELP